jgi:hypothetical protein
VAEVDRFRRGWLDSLATTGDRDFARFGVVRQRCAGDSEFEVRLVEVDFEGARGRVFVDFDGHVSEVLGASDAVARVRHVLVEFEDPAGVVHTAVGL